MTGNYTVRQFHSSDWQHYKAIRLEALQVEPGVYCSSYADESERTESQWQERLSRSDCAYFGLYNNDELVGMAGVMPEGTDGEYELIAAYIKKPHRGKGLSKLLYKARIEWAKSNGVKSLIISHRKSNTASMAANQRFGFKYTYTEEDRLWHDGKREDNLYYKLEL